MIYYQHAKGDDEGLHMIPVDGGPCSHPKCNCVGEVNPMLDQNIPLYSRAGSGWGTNG